MTLMPVDHHPPIHVDHTAVLRAIGLDPKDPKAQAVVLVCDRYGLDPVLKHVILIQGAVYITRDGLLHVAHKSGKFDGIEVIDEAETSSHWTARVSVWRKDFGRAVTYSGRYPKTGTNKAYGPEMAITRAESMALRRAFDIGGIPSSVEAFDPDAERDADLETGEIAPAPKPAAAKTAPSSGQLLHRDFGRLGIAKKADHEDIIFCASSGRTVHADELTDEENNLAYRMAEDVKAGRTTLDTIREANSEHQQTTLTAQFEQSLAAQASDAS